MDESRGGAERRIGEEEGCTRGREEERRRVGEGERRRLGEVRRGGVVKRGEEESWDGGEELRGE